MIVQKPVRVVADRIVQIGQAEVVAELVREHADAAVLRLDRVVAHPVAAAADPETAAAVVGGTGDADVGVERVPAVAPDGVRALRAAARFLALTGVDRLEVVDVAVRLVEVPVAVVVVAIPHVELRQVVVDLLRRAPGRDLAVVPGGQRVAHEQPRARADDAAAVVGAVVGLVERHPHPVGHRTVHRVAVGRDLLVEVAHRDRARVIVEEQVFVVGTREVRAPDRRVVDGPVGLRNLVVQRPRRATVGRVDLRAELADHRPDRVFTFALELDVLAVGDAVRLAGRSCRRGAPGARAA